MVLGCWPSVHVLDLFNLVNSFLILRSEPVFSVAVLLPVFHPFSPPVCCVSMFVFPSLSAKPACPYLRLGVHATSCFILTVPRLMCIAFSFASPVSLCLIWPSCVPCVSTFPNHPHMYILCPFPFVFCRNVSFSSPHAMVHGSCFMSHVLFLVAC